MTDEASFLAAIAAAPDDATLPLVFADWLEEQGDPRGQWSRNYYVRKWMGKTFRNPVPAILKALRKDDQLIDARRAAEVIGEPLVPGILELLKHEKPRVRQQACICLKKIGPKAKAAVPALLSLLADPDRYVREKAAKALEDIGADENTDTSHLKAALTDENWDVRRAASKVLGKMGAKGSVLEELVELFESPDVKDRLEVVEGLAQLKTPEVVPHLDKAIDDPDPEVRVAAVEALGRIKSETVVPVLCRALKSRDSNVRENAAGQFWSYSGEVSFTPEAITSLVNALADKVARVRMFACGALNRAGKLAVSAVPALIKRFADKDPEVRAAAAEAVSILAPDDATALVALIPLLTDEDDGTAGRAAEAISKWKELPESVVPQLQAYVRRARAADSWRMPAGPGVTALGKVPKIPTSVVNELRVIIRDRNNPEWWSSIEALRAMGPAAEPAIPELVLLLSGDHFNHHDVVNALIHIGGPALEELAAIIDGKEDALRWKVLAVLWSAPNAGNVLLPPLLRLLRKTKDDWKVGQVMRAIQALGPSATDAIPVLLDMLEKHGTYQSGSDAFQALCGFKSALIPYIPRLAELAIQAHFEPWKGVFTKLFADLTPEAPEVLNVLRELLRSAAPPKNFEWNKHHGHSQARKEALRGFAILKAVEAIPDVVPLVSDPEVDIRRHAVRFLGDVGTPAALPPLRVALTDSEETVRFAAAEELGSQKDTSKETLAALVHAVEDRAPKVRRAAVEALGKLKTGTEEVLAALETATEDHDKKVAERAAIALKKVTPKEPKKEKTKPKDSPLKAKSKK